jgi:hypothetical protein
VEKIVAEAFLDKEEYRSGDLINRSDVQKVLKQLAAAGWQPSDRRKLVADTLPASAPLTKILHSRRGRRFMRKVADDTLIYDRMDRVSRVSGGRRMLTDIAKLPDGEKLAKLRRPHGVPGFLDLLPKKASGKVRSIRDYDEPTGRIYTEKQLVDRLRRSYRQDSETSTQPADRPGRQ